MGYRGEVMAKFKATTSVVPAVYKHGERFAQLLILPVPEVTFEEAFELSDSERGEGGYGSTGEADLNTESAPTGSVESPAIVEETAEQTANIGSGEAQSSLEQA